MNRFREYAVKIVEAELLKLDSNNPLKTKICKTSRGLEHFEKSLEVKYSIFTFQPNMLEPFSRCRN